LFPIFFLGSVLGIGFICSDEGRGIAQVVSCWLPTSAARVRAGVWSCGFCGGQTGAGACFVLSISVSPASLHSTSWFIFTLIYHLRLVQLASSGCSTKWTESHPTKNNNNNK
jgi:hypothetical protein